MKLFEAVKAGVTAEEVAARYGLKVKRNGLTNCAFHDDKHPSMKVDRRFHCFACQADGDAIDLACQLLGLPPKQAALRLAEDFGIDYDNGQARDTRNGRVALPKKSEKTQAKPALSEMLKEKQEEAGVLRVYLDYHRILNEWQADYQPRAPDEEWHPRFVEALQRIPYIEGALDLLMYGSAEEKRQFIKNYGKEAERIGERIRQIADEREAQRAGKGLRRYAGAAER